MVDILDMEDIFNEILKNGLDTIGILGNSEIIKNMGRILIKEVSDFVSSQQHIKCVNCDREIKETATDLELYNTWCDYNGYS